ncbi:polyhydroxyalkanoate depolymerase [Paraburkholderia lycopersici]|uniref:Polyhydroxyalkanoate depolymerase, intracellular n=1 Tax=Paraburkholderia lycopersici TaxID=416944 RepID=A0A1G7DDA4_9BURK|nr:polyhydroxyalkanoate depolymerase [Paraburkholderia lycopersici]SDE49439.1 polyhydroxyalkanoate depolymerase, intracellular [Paraburkholderia lycopersici]
MTGLHRYSSEFHESATFRNHEYIVAHTPFCDLRHFARPHVQRAVLLRTPLAGHAALMMRETVEALLADGDVDITDWINAHDVPLAAGRFGLDEYVAMLDAFIGALAQDKRPLHVVAVRQSTFPALGTLALRAQRNCASPASITLIGSPLDARINPSTLGVAASSYSLDWCQRHLIDVVPSGFSGHDRHVFPAYLQQAEIAVVYPHRYVSLADRYAQAISRGDADALADARHALIEYTVLLDMPNRRRYADPVATNCDDVALVVATPKSILPISISDVSVNSSLSISIYRIANPTADLPASLFHMGEFSITRKACRID